MQVQRGLIPTLLVPAYMDIGKSRGRKVSCRVQKVQLRVQLQSSLAPKVLTRSLQNVALL